MKKFFVAALLLLAVLSFVSASIVHSDYYYYRMEVVKIFTCKAGFKVLYRGAGVTINEMYIPAEWFVAGGKAELNTKAPSDGNYMNVFYKAGEFSHLRLYVSKMYADDLWAQLTDPDRESKFSNINGIQLKF